MSVPYEIERKYLIKMPEFPLPVETRATDIEQAYLINPLGHSERVRMRAGRYFHTLKVHISNVVREEYENEISKEEYEMLLKRRDPKCTFIQKVRHVFEYEGQTFELDVFPFWKKQAFLEIELPDVNTPVKMPDFIEVMREVTEDLRYTNHSLAIRVPAED
ncbi:MAG: CYTH domain-containing protein [Clostridia bacterium]|nr:CYTH domain-containing protein [Clostridia bacterium]